MSSIAALASRNGAPMMAPIAICVDSAVPETSATAGDRGLRQRRPDGGEQRAGRAVRQAQLLSEPSDGVREADGAHHDQDERGAEEEKIHRDSPFLGPGADARPASLR
jgi:hypothetical protein